MAKPFCVQELQPTSLLRRVIRRKPKGNVLVEINNLLATASTIQEVTRDQVHAVMADYGLNLHEDLLPERQEMFGVLLNHCLADRHLDDSQVQTLKHLRKLLWLHQKDVEAIEKKVAQEVYERTVDEVLLDRQVTGEEKKFLSRLQSQLRLPTEVAESIFTQKSEELIQRTLDQLISDRRLSPAEDDELRTLVAHLGGELSHDEETRRVLDTYRLYWRLENGDLPVIEPGLKLQRTETCHFKTHVDWYEHRKVTKRVGYSGPTVRIRLAKGIYWRAGNMSVQRTSEDVLQLIDSGVIYLTNKRLLFRGKQGNKTISLNRIIDIEAFKNGVQIEKERGKSPFLEFEPGSDVFAMILDRVVDDANRK